MVSAMVLTDEQKVNKKMNIKMFKKIAAMVSEKFPVLVQGRHGVGKSEIIAQIGVDLELPVVNLRLSQMTEGDTLGIPIKDGDFTRFLPPHWLHLACIKPVLLFFDEIDRASEQVRMSIMQLTDSRQLCGNVLHPLTRLFGAGNSGKHGKSYKTGVLDLAEFSRWYVIPFEPSVEDWLLWAEVNTPKIIVDFISKNNDHLEHEPAKQQPNKVYPSRRSWDRFASVCREILESEVKDPETVLNVAEGFLGSETAIAFLAFYKDYSQDLSVADILDKWEETKKSSPSNQQLVGVLRKFDANKTFETTLTPKQTKNLAVFMWDLPDELFVTAFTQLSSKQEGENPANRYTILSKVNEIGQNGKARKQGEQSLGLRFANLNQKE